MVSEKYISIQEVKYLLAKHIPMVMGSLMLERFELHHSGLIYEMSEMVISYYSILTHKFYGFSQSVDYKMITAHPGMVRSYLNSAFSHILCDMREAEMKDQEDILLERVKGEMVMEMERRQNVK